MTDDPRDALGVVQTEQIVRADARLMLAEINGIINRMCTNILLFASQKGRTGSDLRRAVGDLRANVSLAVFQNTLPDKMLAVFQTAFAAGITVGGVDPVLTQLRAEFPTTNGSTWTTQTAIMLALSTQCRVIADTTFVSRDDIEAMQKKMKASFDEAKDMAADEMDNVVYNQLVDLGANLARYLADAALPLPTVVYYDLRPMPALAMSHRIYADASRTEELIRDNKVVHPAFVRGYVRALSD